MNMFLRAGRAAVTLAIGLVLVLATTAPAGASPAAGDTKDGKKTHAARTSAACPAPGERVKTSASDRVYLIDPDSFINWIPADSYHALWDNFNDVHTYDNLFTECYSPDDVFTMIGAHLAKTDTNPAVYIWDSAIVTGGAYRWIVSPAVFDKYGFSWSKIRTQTTVAPITDGNPWHN